MAYNDLTQPYQKDLKTSFEQYFTENDERIKMTWFSATGNTIAIALEFSGIGENPKDMEKIKSNSRKYVYEKVCNSPQILNFLSEGNQMSVDIRNGDTGMLKNIMNLHITQKICV